MGTPSVEEVEQWVGLSVLDAGGQELGRCERAYADDDSGAPEWLLVHPASGRSSWFVPVRDATREGDSLRVSWPAAVVFSSPALGHPGTLTDEDEARLYRHYDQTNRPDPTAAAGGGRGRRRAGRGAPSPAEAGSAPARAPAPASAPAAAGTGPDSAPGSPLPKLAGAAMAVAALAGLLVGRRIAGRRLARQGRAGRLLAGRLLAGRLLARGGRLASRGTAVRRLTGRSRRRRRWLG